MMALPDRRAAVAVAQDRFAVATADGGHGDVPLQDLTSGDASRLSGRVHRLIASTYSGANDPLKQFLSNLNTARALLPHQCAPSPPEHPHPSYY